MPIDYRIPAEIGAIRSRMIDPMTLANLREQVDARRERQDLLQQKYQADQQEVQRVNTLRQLLPKVVTGTDPQTGRAIVDQQVAQSFMGLGGSMADLKSVVDLAEQKQPGSQFLASDTGYYRVSGSADPVPVTVEGRQLMPASVTAPARVEQIRQAGETRRMEKGLSKTEKIDAEMNLAKQYDAQSADYVTVKKQADIIKSALNDPSAIGTLASATAIMKMLDPGSVVRESELGMAMKSTGALDRLGNLFNVVESGNVLTADQKREFAGLVDQFVKAYDQAQRNVNARFARRADSYGLDVGNIVTIPIGAPGELGVSGVPARRPAGGKPTARPPLSAFGGK